MQAIRTEKVTKSFGKKEVLCGIDLSIEKGEIFGLLGPSGYLQVAARRRIADNRQLRDIGCGVGCAHR